jgi:hypothetical protein
MHQLARNCLNERLGMGGPDERRRRNWPGLTE